MKSTAIVCAIAASALGFSSLSFAQGYGDRDGRGDRGDRREWRQEQRQEQRQEHHQRHDRQPQYQQRYNPQHQWSGYAQRYQRGDSLPYQFRQRQYYVNDWRAHRGLYAPPYGYQWVRSDSGDFLLVALATGLIANLLINGY